MRSLPLRFCDRLAGDHGVSRAFGTPIRRLFVPLLLAMATLSWSHPSLTSAVELRMRSTRIDATLTLPVIELKLGWDQPFPPNDATVVAHDYGDGLRRYVEDHVHPVAPDGRPWTVAVGRITPALEAMQDVKVDLTMTPPPGAPVDRLTFGYDVILNRLATHEAIVTLASDW